MVQVIRHLIGGISMGTQKTQRLPQSRFLSSEGRQSRRFLNVYLVSSSDGVKAYSIFKMGILEHKKVVTGLVISGRARSLTQKADFRILTAITTLRLSDL